jgi:hypothetical protein
VAHKRSYNSITLLICIYQHEPIEEVLLTQPRMNKFVCWEQAYSEFAPAFGLSAG